MSVLQMDPAKFSPAAKALYDEIAARRKADGEGFGGSYLALLNHPELAKRIEQLGFFLKFEGVLPRPTYQFIVLSVARTTGAGFEWQDHIEHALAAGLPREVIDAIGSGANGALPHPFALLHAILEKTMAWQPVPEELQARAAAEWGRGWSRSSSCPASTRCSPLSIRVLRSAFVRPDQPTDQVEVAPAWPTVLRPAVVKPFLFIHIRKTAGSSLRSLLANQFPASGVFSNAHSVQERHGWARVQTPESPSRAPDVQFVTGHLDFDYVDRFAQPPTVLTLLREPIALALSAYRFYRGNDEQFFSALRDDWSAAEYASRRRFTDRARQLGLRRFLQEEEATARAW